MNIKEVVDWFLNSREGRDKVMLHQFTSLFQLSKLHFSKFENLIQLKILK